MKKAAQYTGGGGIMALLVYVFDQVNGIEGLEPVQELVAKGVMGLVIVGVTVFLQSRQPPQSQ